MKGRIVITALTFLVLASPCFAHDFWVEKAGTTLKVVYGHGSQRLPYDPSSIKEVRGFDTQGKEIQVGVEKKKDSALLVPKGEASVQDREQELWRTGVKRAAGHTCRR